MAEKLVAIVARYRRDGVVHQAVERILGPLRESRPEVEVALIDLPLSSSPETDKEVGRQAVRLRRLEADLTNHCATNLWMGKAK